MDGQARRMNVVVCFDGSESARKAAVFALQLQPTSIKLLHVVEKTCMDGLIDEEGGVVPTATVLADLDKKREQEATKSTRAFQCELEKLTKVPVQYKVTLAGEARYEIARVLDESLDTDMCVVGSRGLGTMEQLVVGSVSEYVSRNSSVPVMVYRDAKHKKAK